MSTYTFEYCSLHYLNHWLTYDRSYCHVLGGSNTEEKLNALKSAGGFYKVARNLPKKFDEEKGLKRYEPALEVLESTSERALSKNTVEKILDLERKISEKYGNRSVLSLTTKFLWLKFKRPVKIYDSQARIAVGSKDGDLASFYDNWQSSFCEDKTDIEHACTKLPDLSLYVEDQEVGTQEYIKEISSKLWFQERVYDIYLRSRVDNA